MARSINWKSDDKETSMLRMKLHRQMAFRNERGGAAASASSFGGDIHIGAAELREHRAKFGSRFKPAGDVGFADCLGEDFADGLELRTFFEVRALLFVHQQQQPPRLWR